MSSIFRSAGEFFTRSWVPIAVACAVVTAALAFGLTQLEFATGQDSYLDPDEQAAIDNVAFQDQFGGEVVIMLFRGDDDKTVADLVAGDNGVELDRIETELRAIPEAYAVITPYTSVRFSESVVQESVGTNALLAAVQREDSEEAMAARQADISVTLERLGAAGEEDFANPGWVNFLIFGNDENIRGSLQSTFPNEQTAVGGVLLNANADLDTQSAGTTAILDIVESAELDGFEIVVTGSPVFLGEINDYLQGGMLTLGAAALAVMAFVLFFLFRVRWRLLPLLGVILGIVWGFSLVGIVGLDLSLVTISGLPILIGLGVDFAIQMHSRVEEELQNDKPDAVPLTTEKVGPALVAATIAAIVAFTALQISRVPMIRDFGVLLSLGILALLVTGVVVPATILGRKSYTPRTATAEGSLIENFVVKMGSLPSGAAIPLIGLSALIFAGGLALEGSFKIQSDPIEWIDQSSPVVDDLETLEVETGFSSTLGVLIQANDITDEDVIQIVHEFTIDAEARDEIVSTSSLVNTIAKIIAVEGASPLAPTPADIQAAIEVLPEDIAKALTNEDGTATQINLRLAPSPLEDRAVLVQELTDDLNDRIEQLDVAADSPLRFELGEDEPVMRAVPAGLAVIGVSLLENLEANRALLTYLGIALAGLWVTVLYRSVSRTVLTLVPVLLAVGASSVFVGLLGLSLSPLTTVGGPLVVATCTEFSVLILARYMEERNRGLDPSAASERSARRTGLAFFTSAATTVGGFAVLIASPLPLLRDFGIIVALNVTMALIAALVVLPPLMVWADLQGYLEADANAELSTAQRIFAPGAAVAVLALASIAMFAAGSSEKAEAINVGYVPPPPPPSTTAPPTTVGSGEPEVIDPATYPAERPEGFIDGTLYDLLLAQGVEPENANCSGTVLLTRITEDELVALGVATLEPEAVAPVAQAALDCGVTQEQVDATIEAGLG